MAGADPRRAAPRVACARARRVPFPASAPPRGRDHLGPMNGSNTRSGRGVAWLRRHRLFVLIGLTYAYFFQGGDPNQASRFFLTRSLVERHAVDITPDHPLTL